MMLAGHPLHAHDDLERPLALELVEEHLEELGAGCWTGSERSVAVLEDRRLDAPAGLG